MGLKMKSEVWSLILVLLVLVECTNGEDPYKFFTWNVTYGDIYPLGVKQQVLFVLCALKIQPYLCV